MFIPRSRLCNPDKLMSQWLRFCAFLQNHNEVAGTERQGEWKTKIKNKEKL
jgi:hypothetical protein